MIVYCGRHFSEVAIAIAPLTDTKLDDVQQTGPESISDRLDAIRERILRACQRAGRAPEAVTLIGVTKTFPIEDILEARQAGLKHFGENKVQELVLKAEQLPGHAEGGDVYWHMIGHLQRNKARDVVRCADLFHGLDSLRLAEDLDKRASQVGRVLPCLVQVNVSGESSKSGVTPEETYQLLRAVRALPHIRVRGLMTIAEPVDDPELVRPQFQLMRSLFEGYAPEAGNEHEWAYLSMGMSDDFEVAIAEGATHVRVGSAIFGNRYFG